VGFLDDEFMRLQQTEHLHDNVFTAPRWAFNARCFGNIGSHGDGDSAEHLNAFGQWVDEFSLFAIVLVKEKMGLVKRETGEARRRQHRAANRRYQQSPEGRLDHRDRQQQYRERRWRPRQQLLGFLHAALTCASRYGVCTRHGRFCIYEPATRWSLSRQEVGAARALIFVPRFPSCIEMAERTQ
jgi:hypothetical protein